MNIFFLLADRSGCGTYRGIMPMNTLSTRGHHVRYSTMLRESPEQPFDPMKWDVLIAQRPSNAGITVTLHRLFERGEVPVLTEIDDDLIHTHPSNPAHSFWGHKSNRERLKANLAGSSGIIVSTKFLAEELADLHEHRWVFPNFLDATIVGRNPVEHGEKERVVVGWAGGTSHGADIKFVGEELRAFFKRRKDAEFHCIGVDYGKKLKVKRSRYTGWSRSIPDYIASLDFDIGIAPLAPHRFNRGKSHVKALEYASRGIPVVAAKMEPYADFVLHGETGFLAASPKEFVEYVEVLYADAALRAEMGANALRRAEEYTIQGNIERYEGILTSALRRRARS